MDLRERAARISAIARAEARSGEAAIAAVVAELEALSAEPRDVDLAWKRQLGALLELTRVQELEQWNLQQTLRRVTELAVDTLGVARVGAWFFSADASALACADMFDAASRDHTAGARLDRGEFPRYFELLADARVIAVRDACHDPRSVEFAAIYFAPNGVTSTLDAPIRWQGRPTGVLCCEHTGPLRSWRDDELSFIASLADAVGLTLEADRRRRAEQALADKLALIEAQQAALQRLYSPVLELWDGVLAVPLGGPLDAARLAGVVEAVRAAIGERRPAYVLFDLSNLDEVARETADALVHMVHDAGERGAQSVICGADGEVALALGGHAELRGLVTTSSLKTGLQHCIKRR
jgi:anti-anti-sigma regulatory factor